MTTQTIKGQIAFSCDGCSETYEPPRLGLGSEPRGFGRMRGGPGGARDRKTENGSICAQTA